jgi:hypothetical protein
VQAPDFLDKNFLSDDNRYPLVSKDPRMALETNAARALGTNPAEGHIWQEFSSVTFKQLPSPGRLMLPNPFDSSHPIPFDVPQGNGYYRTPSLINVWATAPFMHNNMLGMFNGDPSVKGRLAAYDDAAEKLLWPEKRAGKATIKVTGADSALKIGTITLRIPAGTPIDLLANINVHGALLAPAVLKQLNYMLAHPQLLVKLVQVLNNQGQYDSELKDFVPMLLSMSQSPDLIMDHGHTFGSELPDDQKRALIEYMKTF